MNEEILNIEYHTKRLIVKALNQSRTNEEAAKLLGITWRNLYNLMNRYGIVRLETFAVMGDVKGGRIISKSKNQ